MNKFKPVVTEKHHFEQRVKAFFTNFLEVLDYQDFYARTDINGFQINLCSTGVGFSIQTLLEENKPEVEEESVIEFRKKFKKNKLDSWECSDFDAKSN